MPKPTVITKDMIIDSAFEIVRAEGFSSFSARNVSKKLECSTQPIYWTYKNMEDLKQDVISKILSYLGNLIQGYVKTGKPFLDYGLGYINAAYTEPTLFKIIYVDNILEIKMTDIVPSDKLVEIMKHDVCMAGISDEKLLEIATKSWIFVHGLASLYSSGMMIYDEEKIENMLNSFE